MGFWLFVKPINKKNAVKSKNFCLFSAENQDFNLGYL